MKNTNRPAFHGSDLEQIEAYYHIKKEDIISFGANVNPLGLSPLSKKLWQKIWMSSAAILTGTMFP